MSAKAFNFVQANCRSPVVYVGIDAHSVTYRLKDGSSWTLSRREAREIGVPRLAHLEAA